MTNFLKGYDWVLFGTIVIGGIIALTVFHKAKYALDKKKMDKSKAVAV